MVVDIPQIPIARSGVLKIPSGSKPCRRASAPASVRRIGLRYGSRARRATRGDFQNSLRGSGNLGENSLTKLFYRNLDQSTWPFE